MTLFLALRTWYTTGTVRSVVLLGTTIHFMSSDILELEIHRFLNLQEKTMQMKEKILLELKGALEEWSKANWKSSANDDEARVRYKVLEFLLSISSEFSGYRLSATLHKIFESNAFTNLPPAWQPGNISLGVTAIGTWSANADTPLSLGDDFYLNKNQYRDFAIFLADQQISEQDALVVLTASLKFIPDILKPILDKLKNKMPPIEALKNEGEEFIQLQTYCKAKAKNYEVNIRRAFVQNGMKQYADLLFGEKNDARLVSMQHVPSDYGKFGVTPKALTPRLPVCRFTRTSHTSQNASLTV